MGIGDLEPMQAEYAAWQNVVKEWDAAIGASMNDKPFEPLVRAIRVWGEELNLLRETQEPEMCNRAAAEARTLYAEVAT